MILVLILLVIGFGVGLSADIPFNAISGKYLALVFLALLDSLSYALHRDLSGLGSTGRLTLTRIIAGLVLGTFIIYFGEKSEIDLYLVALLPFALGFSLNMYKFLPK